MDLFRKKGDRDFPQQPPEDDKINTLYFDGLTQMPTRQGLIRSHKGMQPGTGYAFVLICMDLFLDIHRVFGFDAGKQNVIKVAEVIKAFLQPGEDVYREQLDTFGLLIKINDEEDMLKRIDALLDELSELEVEDGSNLYKYPRSFSCGIYEITDDDLSPDHILEMTSLALRNSREQKKKYSFYNKSMQEERASMRQLLGDIEGVMKREEIVPYFHPRYDLNTGRIVGADVLARWNHPKRGLIMPQTFIPLMQQVGTILDLDMYMLEQACRLINEWTENESMPVPLSVNIAPLNVYKRNFTERVLEIIEKNNTAPRLIELEMDESTVFENSQNIIENSKVLADAGVCLCIDHFGAGYSSLKLLTDVPAAMIKLDKKFLNEGDSERNFIVMKNMVQSAHDLGKLVVATGIESREHIGIFKKINCNQGMGFLFSKPMPLESFEAMTL